MIQFTLVDELMEFGLDRADEPTAYGHRVVNGGDQPATLGAGVAYSGRPMGR